MKTHSLAQSSIRFLTFVGRHFSEDGCFYRAGALTFTAILSIVPLLAVSFAILAAVPSFQESSSHLQGLIIKNFVATSGQTVEEYLQQFVHQAYHLSIVGLVFLLITALSMFYSIEQTFNTIWHVNKPHRNFTALIIYWLILLLAPLLIALGLGVTTYVLSLSWIAQSTDVLGISPLLVGAMSLLLTATAFSALYIVVPNCKVPISNGIISGIIAAILFEIAKHTFTVYVALFPTYTLLYGALAAIPLFLVWIYISWFVVLLGAEICYALTYFQKHPHSH